MTKPLSWFGGGLGVVRVLLDYGLARIAPKSRVRHLVSALGDPREETAMAAYMALVKLGPRIASHLLDAARAGHQTADVLRVLRDQGDSRVIPSLETFVRSSDPAVANAARESIAALSKVNGPAPSR